MWNSFHGYGHMGTWGPGFWFMPILFLLIPLVIALKGYSLWHAAKRSELWWFIAILVLNTMGILELIYIIFVLKKFTARKEAETYKKEESTPHTHSHEHKQ
jgi:hypothetical protein